MTKKTAPVKYFYTKTLDACIEKASELAARLTNISSISSSEDPELEEFKETIKKFSLLTRITKQLTNLLELKNSIPPAKKEKIYHAINFFNGNLVTIFEPLKSFRTLNKKIKLLIEEVLLAATPLDLTDKKAAATLADAELAEEKLSLAATPRDSRDALTIAAIEPGSLLEEPDAEEVAAAAAAETEAEAEAVERTEEEAAAAAAAEKAHAFHLGAAELIEAEAAARLALMKEEWEKQRLTLSTTAYEAAEDKLYMEAMAAFWEEFIASEDALSAQRVAVAIDITGKTYFDDFAKENEKNRILGHEKMKNPRAAKKEAGSSENETYFFFRNLDEPSAAAAAETSSPHIARRIVQSGDKKSRTVEWRVEGKSTLPLEQQYEELAQQSLSFKVAEQLVLQDEITILERVVAAKQRAAASGLGETAAAASAGPTTNETPTNYTVHENPEQRLAELKALQEATKPLERFANISVPNQKPEDRKERVLKGKTFQATNAEFLAVKAHVKFYDTVVFYGVKFEKTPDSTPTPPDSLRL